MKILRVLLLIAVGLMSLSLLWQVFVLTLSMFRIIKATANLYAAIPAGFLTFAITFAPSLMLSLAAFGVAGDKMSAEQLKLKTLGTILVVMLIWSTCVGWLIGGKIIAGFADGNPKAAIKAGVYGSRNPWNTLQNEQR